MHYYYFLHDNIKKLLNYKIENTNCQNVKKKLEFFF